MWIINIIRTKISYSAFTVPGSCSALLYFVRPRMSGKERLLLIQRYVMSCYVILQLCKSSVDVVFDEEYSRSFNMFMRPSFSFLQTRLAVTLWTCMREALGSNVGPNIGSPAWRFSSIFTVYPGKCRDNIHITLSPLPSKSFPIHYSPIILPWRCMVSDTDSLPPKTVTNNVHSVVTASSV
jgi:hypothetical protein